MNNIIITITDKWNGFRDVNLATSFGGTKIILVFSPATKNKSSFFRELK
jgi:hypothetical protein